MSKRDRCTRGQSSSSQEVSLEENIRRLGVFRNGIHHDALTRRHIYFEDIIDWEFLARQGLDQAFYESIKKTLSPAHNGYDPNHLGVRFRLGGEQREISFLELGWRVGLYFERQSRESVTLSELRKGVTVKANHLLLGFWTTIGDGGFNIGNTKVGEEDEEDDEAIEAAGGNAGNEGVGGSVDMYRNISQGDWQVRQARWMDQQEEHWGRFNTWMGQQEERANWMYDHTICQFQYMSTHDNLDPHLRIDPFPGREADYPPYGYTGHMPPGYE
ncbi:hypothetical protein Tco_0045509 [Tanacetum coccineum]